MGFFGIALSTDSTYSTYVTSYLSLVSSLNAYSTAVQQLSAVVTDMAVAHSKYPQENANTDVLYALSEFYQAFGLNNMVCCVKYRLNVICLIFLNFVKLQRLAALLQDESGSDPTALFETFIAHFNTLLIAPAYTNQTSYLSIVSNNFATTTATAFQQMSNGISDSLTAYHTAFTMIQTTLTNLSTNGPITAATITGGIPATVFASLATPIPTASTVTAILAPDTTIVEQIIQEDVFVGMQNALTSSFQPLFTHFDDAMELSELRQFIY